MKTEILIQRHHWSRNHGVYIRLTEQRGERYFEAIAQPLTMTQLTDENAGTNFPPCFELRADEMQQLMDELWRVGMRPSEGSGSAGALAATQHHLADMRTISHKLIEEMTKSAIANRQSQIPE